MGLLVFWSTIELGIVGLTPIMSHRMGRWVRFQKMGVIVMFSTAQREAERVIAVRSRVLNPSNTFTSITFSYIGNTLIKVFLV